MRVTPATRGFPSYKGTHEKITLPLSPVDPAETNEVQYISPTREIRSIMKRVGLAFSRPYVYPLVVSISSFIIYYFVKTTVGGIPILENFFAGVSAATFGSYITVILVERSFRIQEENRRQRMQNAALRQLRLNINKHLSFLGNMYIASSQEYPSSSPNSYSDFFNNEFFRNVQFLDFSEEFPTAREHTCPSWFYYSENQIREFQESIDQAINQYSGWMDPELVNTLNEIKDSELLNFILGISEADIVELDRRKGHERHYAILLGFPEMIQEHTTALLELIEQYDDIDDIEVIDVEAIWSENATPHPNSARIDPAELVEDKQDR